MESFRRRVIPALAAVALLSTLQGCGVFTTQPARQEVLAGARRFAAAGPPLSREQLGQVVSAFADRYVLLMADACDRIKDESPDYLQRVRAHDLKTRSATSVYDIVTNADPYTQLFDMTVAITLQSIVQIDEDTAEATFGPERGRLIVKAVRKARVEIWEIAAQVLTVEQLENLDFMIWDWRLQNPTVIAVIDVRFNDFAGSRGKTMVSEAASSGLFAPIDDARKSVDELRLLGERAFLYSKRAPLLLAWRTEATVDAILAKPEVRGVLNSMDAASVAAEKTALAIDKLPAAVAAERKALLDAFDERQGKLGSLLKDTRATIADAGTLVRDGKELLVELQRASAALGNLVKEADAAAARFVPTPAPAPTPGAAPAATSAAQASAVTIPAAAPPAAPTSQPAIPAVAAVALPPAAAIASSAPAAAVAPAPAAKPPAQASPAGPHPFDIREYTQALVELTKAARELNAVVSSSRGLLGAPEWTRRIEEINAAADDRVRLARAQSQTLVDSIFARVYIAMGALLGLLVIYKIIALALTRRGAKS